MTSANPYYDLAEHDDDLGLLPLWESYAPIPSPGENDALDAFLEEKHLDHASLIRVGARMKDYRTLAYIGPGYLKYRNVETGEKIAVPGSSFHALRIVQGYEREGVIIAEGETDGARLTMLYPNVDVAILPGGALHWTEAFARQLEGYGLVLAGHDRDEAGEQGWGKVKASVPWALRFPPPEGCNDWCSLNGGSPPELPPAPDRPKYRHLVRLDVASMLETEPPDIPWLARPLLARGFLSMLSGREGRGKSMLALFLAAASSAGHPLADLLTKSATVLYLDAENGPVVAHRRLHKLSVDLERFEYFDAGGLSLDRDLDVIEQVCSDFDADIVVFDSLTALAPGFDERNAQSNETYLRPLQRMAQQQKRALLLLHHSPKYGAEYRGDTALGAIVDIGWNLSWHEKDPERRWRRCLSNWKMRPAEMEPERWFAIRSQLGRPVIDEAPAFDEADPDADVAPEPAI